MRLLLVLALAAGCGVAEPAPASNPHLCQVVVYLPGVLPTLPFLWTCTSGVGDQMTGRPDHAACIQCVGEQLWTATEGGACVPDCATCTPAYLISLDPHTRCTPLGREADDPEDMAGDLAW